LKPYKSFIFLVSVLLFVVGAYFFFMPERVFDFISRKYGDKYSNEAKTTVDSKSFLAELKKKESAIAEINAQYRIPPETFTDDLRNVPLEPFIYDTNNPLKQLYTDLLQQHRSPQLLRFLHYGDEQIENDKITGTFRKLLQNVFGGNGNGIVPLFQNAPSVKISNNWSVMSMQKNQRRGNYGLCNAYLYPPAINALITSRNIGKGTVEIRGIAGNGLFLEALLHEDVWVERDLHATVLKGSTRDTLGIPVKQENSFGLQHCVWKLPDNATGINISLTLFKNRNIYALSINSKAGIIVDNLFQRGSEGNIFLKNNRRFLIDNHALMNVRLIVYQFKPASDFYETMLQQELGYLRITVPDVPVIVVGNSEIQREIAVKNNCVYWNLHENTASELAGKMLYKAFITDYKNFVIKERERKINEYVFIH
jgi:hypothetical protein